MSDDLPRGWVLPPARFDAATGRLVPGPRGHRVGRRRGVTTAVAPWWPLRRAVARVIAGRVPVDRPLG